MVIRGGEQWRAAVGVAVRECVCRDWRCKSFQLGEPSFELQGVHNCSGSRPGALV